MGKYDSIIITLYKGRYEKSSEDAIQYRTFGEFDYIQISDVPICIDQNDVDYSKLWQKTEEISRELNVGESCHNLYAFCARGSQTEQFWNDKKPYIFVSLLQFKTGLDGKVEEKAKELEEYLNNGSDQKKKFNYAVYYSLDSCDFVIFIKTTVYEIGAEQVQSFSVFSGLNTENNSYSYSICGIDFQELLQQDQEDIFDKVMICFVVKQVSAYQKWYERFTKVFPQISRFEVKEDTHFNYNRLGNEDVCINIMLCNIKKLIRQMKEGGCLWSGDEDFQKGIMKLRIHFDTRPYIDRLPTSTETVGVGSTYVESDSYIQIYMNKVSDKAKEQLYPFVKKALEEVLRSCSYLEEEDFARDVRKSTKVAIEMLFDKMNEFWVENTSEAVEGDISKNQIVYNESVVMVVQGIMSIVNGSLHTDRMFFQSPGFNAVLYDIPVKMLAFYNDFVQKLVNILNDQNEKRFCYLLCPDLYLSIKIKKLFDNKYEYPKQRFLLGNIPVKAIFEPKRLMQELVHEVAHCVGDSIRLRSQRWRYTVAMFAETIATYMLSASDNDSDIIHILGNIYDKIGNQRKDELHVALTRRIERYLSEKFIPIKRRTEFDYYQIKTECFFETHVRVLLSEHLEQLLEVVESAVKKSYKETNRPILEYVSDMSKFINVIHNNVKRLLKNLYSINTALHRLTNESFADLVMCEALGIDMDEYVELFYNTHREERDDPMADFLNYSRDVTAERIVSVVRCYDKKIGQLQYNVEDNNYCIYRRKLMIYSQECAEADGENVWIMLPPAVIRNNIKYLKECRTAMERKHIELDGLQQIYKSVTGKEADKSVLAFLET